MKSLWDSPRVKAMKAALTKTYTACGLPIPNENGLKVKTFVFCEDLDDIPDRELDVCFRIARLSRNDSFFPATGQLIKAWQTRSAEIERDKQENEIKELPEPSPEGIETDCNNYFLNPTPEKLEELKKKYPNAGF